MKNQDSSFLPLKKVIKRHTNLKNPNKHWSYVFHNLLSLTNNPEEILSIIHNSPLHDLFSDASNQNSSIPEYVHFSLDEYLSSTHLTPFHLSSIDSPTHSLKRKGQYFTPSYISHYIVKQSFQHFIRANKEKSIIQTVIADIACGTGNLVIPILAYVREKMLDEKKSLPSDILKFITSNLYGFDLDPVALTICKLRIFFFLSLHHPDVSIPNLSSNFLLGNSLLNESFSFTSDMEYFTKPVSYLASSTARNTQFDIIVSNPPYMVYGLRNAQNYHDDYKKFLRENFISAEYKLSMYPLFIERSIKLLKNGGILGIITPDSFLLGKYYSKVRSFILKNTKILELSMLGFEPFSHVTIGRPTLSFLRKTTESEDNVTADAFPVNQIVSKDDFLNSNWISYPNFQNRFDDTPLNRFYLYFNEEDENFISNWEAVSSFKIDDIATIHTGIRSRIGQKNIIANKSKGKDWKRGIISSSQVLPFHINYKDNWLNLNPTNLWAGGFNKEIIENPKILIRQTGFQIITSVDTNGYYHLNNVHSLKLLDNSFNIYALSCILNSKDFNRLYHVKSMEKGRALAQIDIDFLLTLTLPDISQKDVLKLETFYFQQEREKAVKGKFIAFRLKDILGREIF